MDRRESRERGYNGFTASFSLLGTTARVVGRLAATEKLQGGESLDLEPAGKLLLGSGINLGDAKAIFLQGLGSLGVLRGQTLAVSAPLTRQRNSKYESNEHEEGEGRLAYRSVEFYKKRIMGTEGLIKVAGGEDQHVLLLLNRREGNSREGGSHKKLEHCRGGATDEAQRKAGWE